MNINERNYYVYGYIRLDTNSYFYIGKGKNNRCERMNNRKAHFLSIVNKFDCCYEIIKNNLTEEEALQLEIDTIEDLVFNEGYDIEIPKVCKDKERGHTLVNQTWGGDGTSGYSIKQSEETVTRRVLKNTGKKRNEEQKNNLGKARKKYIDNNEEELNRLRTLRNGSTLSVETKNKISKANMNKKASKKAKENMSLAWKNKSKEELEIENKKRAIGVKRSKRALSNIIINIYDKNMILIKNFNMVCDCAEWLLINHYANTFNGARASINEFSKNKKLYRNMLYIEKKLSPATTEYENANNKICEATV